MASYNLFVPDGTNAFQYGTDSQGNPITYSSNSEFKTNDPCQAIDFYNAAKATNPEMGREDVSKGFWEATDYLCTVKTALAPFTPLGISPVENIPSDNKEDSALLQGAPDLFAAGTIKGIRGSEDVYNNDNPNPIPTEEPRRQSEGERDPINGNEPHEQTNAGDPVDIFSGAFYLEETDLVIPNTILPLGFTRSYQSGAASFGPLGWNWDHNFNIYIRELKTGDIALWRNLHEYIFRFDGTNFEPPRGAFEKLERVTGITQVFEIAGKGVVMHFERVPGWIDVERIPLLWIKDQHGNKLQFTYGAEDKLAEVRDDDDRFFHFDYDECGLLVALTDNAGRKFSYDHDEETMQLVCVTSPPISDHPDGITRIYHYEQPWALPQLRHNIVRVEDARGNVYLENTYDQDPSSWSYARVTEQFYGGFLYQFQYTQLQWVPPNPVYINIPALRVEVMNPDFGLETYTFNYRGDLLDRRYRLSKDNSYRVVVWQYEFDEQGNPSKTTGPDGSEEINTFDFANPDPRMRNSLVKKEITSAWDFLSPSRIIWTGKYEPAYQQITEEKNETRAITIYKYDFDITPSALTNTGKLIEIIQPDCTLPDDAIQQAKTTFEYNAKGQLTAIVHPDGTRNELKYGIAGDEKSRLVKQIFNAGGLDIEHTLLYDNFGFNSEIIDGKGNSTGQIFNSLGLPEKSILPAINGQTAEHILHYDSDKKVISTERPKGTYTDTIITGSHINDKMERDVLGYPVKYILSSNTGEPRILIISNDYRGQPIETINPDGSRIRTAFDERGLPLSEEVIGTDGKKIKSENAYYRAGKIMQETNPFGHITKYEYDGFSRISKVMLPNGTEIKYKWLKDDMMESEETTGDDGSGIIRRQLSFKLYTYDEKNRRVSETIKAFTDDPSVSTNVFTTFFYDNLDRLVKSINNRGGVSNLQYDGLGRLIIETDPMGNEQYYTYDNNNNLIQADSHHIEPDGSISVITKKFKFDARNRKTELIEPDGAKVIVEYDDRNLVVKQTDYLGILNETFYDSYNNKIRDVYDHIGLNIINRWTIDNMSRVTSYIDPTGQVSDYSFDTVGRTYKTNYPNGFSSEKTFNDFSQIIKEQLGSGVVFEYTYDAANRISKIENTVSPSPIIKVANHEFNYDGLDRMLTAKASTNAVIRKYDSLSRLLSETMFGNTISCDYNDATGEVEKIWPDGRTEKLSHNLNGILTRIEETVGGSLGSGNPLLATFKPSGPNFFGEASYQGGVALTNQYDERKRLTGITFQSPSGTNENIKYRYNAGNIKQVEAITGQNSKISYFEFDNKYRLLNSSDGFASSIPDAANQAEHDIAINTVKTSALAAIHQESFLYNLGDARTKYAETGVTDKNYTYLPGHRTQDDGTNVYTHHPDGTLKSDGLFDYETDALGRIVTIKVGANIITEISYDAFGRPAEVKEAGEPVKSFNYLGGLIEQENENGVASRQITIQPFTGVPVAFHSAIGTHYTLFDGRFNLVGLVDDNGNLIETYRYKPFGLPRVYDDNGSVIPASTFGTELVFGGQRYLSTTGLFLSKRRLMNPVNGVFLSEDPKGYVDSSSLYVYAAQNAINNIDPNGDILPAIVAIVVIGGLIAGSGFSVYDNIHNPQKYQGAATIWKPVAQVVGGGLIAGASVLAGEAILAAGGTATATYTAVQTFVLYGTSSAISGSILRGGFNSMFPEYINPVTSDTIIKDYVLGGAVGIAFRSLGLFYKPVIPVKPTMPTPTIVPHGALGDGVNGATYPGGSLVSEIGWLGQLGLKRQIYNPTIFVDQNPIGSTVANVIKHEMQHAADAIKYPQLYYLSAKSQLPGRGTAALIREMRGYYKEFGVKGLSPNYAWRSIRKNADEKSWLVAEGLTLAAAGMSSLALHLTQDTTDEKGARHPNETRPSIK